MTLDYSIIVPAWNEEAALPATLKTLSDAIEDIGRPAELIVVDDASTDRTPEIARSFGARVERVEKRQIAAVRNAGARIARGSAFLFVDADTLVPSETIRATLAALDAGAVGGGARIAMDERPPLLVLPYLAVFLVIWKRLGYAAGCYIWATREAFEEIGGFDERFYASEEAWLSKALMARGRFTLVDPPVITSGRKWRTYRAIFLLWRSTLLVLRGPKAWQRREGLDIWYEGRRERT